MYDELFNRGRIGRGGEEVDPAPLPTRNRRAADFLSVLAEIANLGWRCYFSSIRPSELDMTININLTPQLEAMVREKVASGRYGSASEVVREALRLMQEHDHLRTVKLEQLRSEVRAGIESGSAGELDIAAIKRKGRERLAKTTKR